MASKDEVIVALNQLIQLRDTCTDCNGTGETPSSIYEGENIPCTCLLESKEVFNQYKEEIGAAYGHFMLENKISVFSVLNIANDDDFIDFISNILANKMARWKQEGK